MAFCVAVTSADGVCALLQAATTPAPAVSQPSLLARQLKDVQKKRAEVEKESSDLRTDKPEGWQDELAYLREEKKQLHEKELLLLSKLDTSQW